LATAFDTSLAGQSLVIGVSLVLNSLSQVLFVSLLISACQPLSALIIRCLQTTYHDGHQLSLSLLLVCNPCPIPSSNPPSPLPLFSQPVMGSPSVV
jgi:hypothetical protein